MAIDYNRQLDKLAQAFNEREGESIRVIPTKPDAPEQVLSLPPSNLKNFYSQPPASEVVEQRKMALNSQSSTTKNTLSEPPHPSFTLLNEQGLVTKERTQESVEREREIEQQLPLALLEHEHKQVGKEGEIVEGVVSTTTIGAMGNLVEMDEFKEMEKVSPTPTSSPRRGRPKGSRNKCNSGSSKNRKTLEREKLSRGGERKGETNLSIDEKVSKRGKVSQPIAVNVKFPVSTSVKGKTSLCYALLYSKELTPVQVEKLLEKQDEICLTSAEVIALDLIDRTVKHDPKAEKIYWDLLKNQQKNEKSTPIKSENTLLDDALAKAENAIFGEIVVDNPDNP